MKCYAQAIESIEANVLLSSVNGSVVKQRLGHQGIEIAQNVFHRLFAGFLPLQALHGIAEHAGHRPLNESPGSQASIHQLEGIQFGVFEHLVTGIAEYEIDHDFLLPRLSRCFMFSIWRAFREIQGKEAPQ